jgi:hypothetical protein
VSRQSPQSKASVATGPEHVSPRAAPTVRVHPFPCVLSRLGLALVDCVLPHASAAVVHINFVHMQQECYRCSYALPRSSCSSLSSSLAPSLPPSLPFSLPPVLPPSLFLSHPSTRTMAIVRQRRNRRHRAPQVALGRMGRMRQSPPRKRILWPPSPSCTK